MTGDRRVGLEQCPVESGLTGLLRGYELCRFLSILPISSIRILATQPTFLYAMAYFQKVRCTCHVPLT